MLSDSLTLPAIVVGIDGSTAALRAAVWAVDEAVSRDIPLRLVHAFDVDDSREPHAAESAVRHVIAAVEATGGPVKIETDFIRGHPVSTLARASRAAAMLCVGAVGSDHFEPERVGSTAATVAASAHCPVAVVHGHGRPTRTHLGWVVAEADKAPDNGVVLGAAVEEARLRNAPLRVITRWQSPSSSQCAIAEGDRRIRARLARRLAPWRRRYPDLQIESIAVHGSILEYLAKNAADMQLLVVGARDPHRVSELCGPAGYAAIGDCDCVLLVVDHQHL